MDSTGPDGMDPSYSGDNVVPIGTHGRPGRGGRRSTPSSAARSLAGGSAPKKAAAKKSAPKKASRTGKKPAAKKPAPAAAAAAPPSSLTPETKLSDAHTAEVPETEPRRPAEPAARREGIAVTDWITALMTSARAVLGDDWEAKGAVLLAQLRRRLTGDYPIDEFGLDPQVQAILLGALRPLAEKWFRVEVRGADNIPADGGALIVANHSGTVPVDAAITGLVVHDHAGRNLRMLGADLVFKLPFVGELARKTGATLACTEDAERLLTSGHIAGVWPEGFKGIGKPYAERYKLQRFGRGGFVSSAMRAGVPIVPVSIVGAEEIYPLVGNVPSLARLMGVPYIPITPFFPLLGPLGMIPLPSKWIIEFGEPIRTDAYSKDAADDPMLVFNVTDQVRETIQQTLYSLLVDRGHPFV